MRGRRVLLALALPLLLAVGGVAPRDELEGLARGRQVYNTRCYFCHGYSGDAKTLAASYLEPPPRDFTAAPALQRTQIVEALRHGRPGTAMKAFDTLLSTAEIDAVARFVERSFVHEHARNAAYHTPENGWPDHERYRPAFAFATGAVALDAAPESLSEDQRRGRALFQSACISCHDHGRVADPGPAWMARPLSYPRIGFAPGDSARPAVDAVSSASVYAQHDVVPRIDGLTPRERRGEALFQANCAFCHGADGTGRNWIGQFMEPKARDLTQYGNATMPPARLRRTIAAGLPGTSMPAWRQVLRPAEIDAVAAYVARAFFRREPRDAS